MASRALSIVSRLYRYPVPRSQRRANLSVLSFHFSRCRVCGRASRCRPSPVLLHVPFSRALSTAPPSARHPFRSPSVAVPFPFATARNNVVELTRLCFHRFSPSRAFAPVERTIVRAPTTRYTEVENVTGRSAVRGEKMCASGRNVLSRSLLLAISRIPGASESLGWGKIRWNDK